MRGRERFRNLEIKFAIRRRTRLLRFLCLPRILHRSHRIEWQSWEHAVYQQVYLWHLAIEFEGKVVVRLAAVD